MHTGMDPARGVWWRPVHGAEKIWVGIAFGWCLVLFAMMPLWHWKGGQNPSGIRHRVDPEAFRERTEEFIRTYRVGEDGSGIPVVAPPPGSHVYLLGQMWAWRPTLRLRAGREYVLHLSSLDVNHGFSLYPLNINFQVVPGYDYGLRIRPTEAGDFRIVCNEFCGIGHHLMVGRVLVEDEEGRVPGLASERSLEALAADAPANGGSGAGGSAEPEPRPHPASTPPVAAAVTEAVR